ncbi:aminodeoxychorismate synthase component I [Maritimibacter sp. DP1N21-5]|uniref:aminodeoxychorismate synthase component I n=1 Tax=Maritimibacter sp. DP1N21-5 TaxID=2836867 RepID=UPI001C443D85|nr:aminodeoxychorismate synthase component I [Maritimibacter sp. DP1N21-5]MBV7410212.1 aminodeoxychorismate synthase component I [Maritimibacter sp. DP1N21-5]
MTAAFVHFDRGPSGAPCRFEAPVARITARTPDEVPAAFAALEGAQAAGHWLAGMTSYELGYALDLKLAGRMPEARQVPLIDFGVFGAPLPACDDPIPFGSMTPPEALWSQEDYQAAFDRVHGYIAAGDIYQANLTFSMRARLIGSAEGLYAALAARQVVPHGAMVDLAPGEEPTILSRSPELFFEVKDNLLTTRPMKGTAARGATPGDDASRRKELAESEKNQAENLMIVDLLRNDMSRVSIPGTVRVPELFRIESYATLHQMTSRVTSQLRPGTTISELFGALHPCGSVTGAPKIRAMEIIDDLEAGPRGAYCGAIGWIAPGGDMCFNVAIRTLTVHPDGTIGLNVGGGVVYDSTGPDEYTEALLKADFARLEGAIVRPPHDQRRAG